MSASNILIGGESFRRIREDNCYYIDKTMFLEELLSQTPPMVSLITRPRRFGKTLNMTMLQEFFDIRQDSRKLFEGLAISRNESLCGAWMNKYPSAFLSLKLIEGQNFKHALEHVAAIISGLCIEHEYLVTSPKVSESDRQDLSTLMFKKGSPALLEVSLFTLCRALHSHWGKPAILLIDEYDVPLARAEQNGYYSEMVTFIRNMLGAALKTNPSLQLAVLTGCLRIAKESIFTGLNNFKCYGISDPKFSDKFGFTSQEVDALLSDAHFSDKKDVMREWYDGYRFGLGQEIYCPWDILQYVDDLQTDPNAKPQAYWSNTSSNSIIKKFIGRTDFNTNKKFETLLSGESIEVELVESLTYDTVHSSEENLWSMLYLTGYLTKAQEEGFGDKTRLVIPNKEIRKIFIKSVRTWFTDTMKVTPREELLDAFWAGDGERFTKQLAQILLNSISFHDDHHEDFYHAVLVGLFIGCGYDVESNHEVGYGRPDIVIIDRRNARAAVIETKHSSTLKELDANVSEALRQIVEKKYDAEVREELDNVLLWGMAFFKKRCLARAER